MATKVKISKWRIISIVLAICLAVSLYFNFRDQPSASGTVDGQAASQKALTVLQTLVQPGTNLNVVNVRPQNGIYNISLNVNNQPVDVFVTSDGRYLFTSIIDLQNPPQPQQQQQQQTTPSAQISNLDLTGQPMEGDQNANVTIVEFSDFQCPFCGQFFAQTYPQLKQDYIDTGKVKVIFVNFPLTQLHPFAEKGAEAGMCAFEQGKFWEMHDKMFSNQNALAVSDLENYAQSLGLNSTQFNQCLETGKYQDKVNQNEQMGISVGVSGTPTFFINGQQVTGAQPYSVFQQAIGG